MNIIDYILYFIFFRMWIESVWLSNNLDENTTSPEWLEDFYSTNYSQNLENLQQQMDEERDNQSQRADVLIQQLPDEDIEYNETTELSDKKVENFVRKNCCEPIKNVNKIVPFNELIEILKKSAEKKDLPEIKKSIGDWNAKDQRIYKLPAYKKLVRRWFILPSDIRTYYDSANKEPVYHLGVDYNVKAWKKVKAIYDGKVVESRLDWWLWHKVILEHKMPDWTKFYSLYWHLGPKHLPKVWDTIKKWKRIWHVWKPFTEDNWNRNEHLHFQIMKDMESPEGYSKIEWEWNYDVLNSFGKNTD